MSFSGEYSFLSNFHPSPVLMDGQQYPTVEHAFQAAKTNSVAERQVIQMISTPGQAKRQGRKVTLRGEWEVIKLGVMLQLLRRKFDPDSVLAYELLATGDKELIETNTSNDTYWGVCGGKGENHLGKLLMQVRNELQQGERRSQGEEPAT
jgi:hypothetical protein